MKVSIGRDNRWCPRPLYLFGTFREDGTPDFGLFCWFSYAWTDGLAAITCIGENKLTLDRIRATKVFSANLVTEATLPLADYFGSVSGYDPEKMNIPLDWEKGETLNVPILSDCPMAFELEVRELISLNDEGSTVLICEIRNTLVDPMLEDESIPTAERLARMNPVTTAGHCEYWSWQGQRLGGWHGLAKQIREDIEISAN
ncbi:MAG: flavin reductase [Christensenellaceae bacterium]|nr:flavin reductase [Christensenellaceae bacterium]